MTDLQTEPPRRAWYEPLLDRGILPDRWVRAGIRRRLAGRLREESQGNAAEREHRRSEFAAELAQRPIAIATAAANEQHYELPPDFFRLVLGPRLKYSCTFWPTGTASLAASEDAMLELTAERAQLADGQRVLDLGCGWGSLTFWVLEHCPRSQVVAVSNSAVQREFIEGQARQRGFDDRLEVRTADANHLQLEQRFDRIVSIEMFEHMKNYRSLLARLAGMLQADGKLFVHVFSHREHAYDFEVEGDWIGRYFFTGGTMPSHDLLPRFQEHVTLEDAWELDGTHYERTANAWLAQLDAERAAVLDVLARAYGEIEAPRWLQRWRVFFMACAELWGFAGGSEWQVSHYRFAPAASASRSG
ncbi:MAG: cyclopropane-fatty-acyl-phospholipid synthase family protein [Planctomycetota bacterium]